MGPVEERGGGGSFRRLLKGGERVENTKNGRKMGNHLDPEKGWSHLQKRQPIKITPALELNGTFFRKDLSGRENLQNKT